MDIPTEAIYAVIGFGFASLVSLIGFLIKEIFGSNKKLLAENTKATLQNTMAIQTLNIEISYLRKSMEAIPEMRKDIDGLGQKIRDHVDQ